MNSFLLGKKIQLLISDPWDFGTELGSGPFEAIIENMSQDLLLIHLKKPWIYQNALWEYLVAQSREINSGLSALQTRKKILVNFIRTTPDQVREDPEFFGAKSYRGKYSMLTGSVILR